MTEQKLRLKLDNDKLKKIVTDTISRPSGGAGFGGGFSTKENRDSKGKASSSEQERPKPRSFAHDSSYFIPKNTSGFASNNGGEKFNKPSNKFSKPSGKFKKPFNQGGKNFGSKKPYPKKKKFANPTPPSTFDLHLRVLQEKFPIAFPRDTRIPLGSNIRHKISEVLNISNKEANLFLFWYCHGSRYLDNFKIGANKLNLEGEVVGQVTVQDLKVKNDAFEVLQESIKRKKEKDFNKDMDIQTTHSSEFSSNGGNSSNGGSESGSSPSATNDNSGSI